MYCSHYDIIKDLDKSIVIELVNDEQREHELINLDDATDLCRVRIDEAISDADDESNVYYRAKYKLPFITVPTRVKKISKELAIYNLYLRRHRQDMPEYVAKRRKEVIDELIQIQKGLAKLDVVQTVTEAAQNSDIQTNKSASDRIFSKSVLDKY